MSDFLLIRRALWQSDTIDRMGLPLPHTNPKYHHLSPVDRNFDHIVDMAVHWAIAGEWSRCAWFIAWAEAADD